MKTFDVNAYAAKARETVAAGSVLLRNEGALPFAPGSRVAVFGRSQFNYYKSGTGSGGMVNTAPVAGITQALEESGDVSVDQGVKAAYEAWLADHPFCSGQGWAAEPWFQEEMPLDAALVAAAAARNDAAVAIIGRTAGEDKDNSADEGSYCLTAAERDMLKKVCAAFTRVAVVLNVGNIIDMSWVEEYRPQAVLYVWQGGQEGGHGAADVLTGRTFPSGKLSDTIARRLEDYPAFGNFGSETRNVYQEDIYVGYRYFETFSPETAAYPFGFGLGYTTFSVSFGAPAVKGGVFTLPATVVNTGARPGREVVQLYVEKPQGRLGQPARALVDFAKSPALAPGGSASLTLSCASAALASYDDSGVTGHANCWVLEAGEYRFFAGTDVRSAAPVGSMTLEETVVERLEEALAPVTPFKRLRPGPRGEKAWEDAPLRTVDPAARRLENLPAARPCTGDKGWKLGDVLDGKVSLEAFVDQLTDEELVTLVRGEGMCSPKVTAGTAGAFGGVTEGLLAKGIPTACCADGPSGIRMDCGARAFAMPNGTSLACTFDLPLVEELYEYEGLELRKNRVDTLLGPGINIHRHPLNGRNFEYFSEDPLLTGRMAAAQLRAMHRYSVTGTIKHFACNSQETHRHDVEAVVSQRALREIYLKAYEIAVKEGGARSIMSSYNPINGYWAASNYDLLTTILRGDWGFTGQVMTDWWARGNDPGALGQRGNMAAMIRAQNDLYMVAADAASNSNRDNSAEALNSGAVTRQEYLRSAENICRFLLESPALQRLLGRETPLDEALAHAPSFDEEEIPLILVEPEPDDPGHIVIPVERIGMERGANTRFTIAVKQGGLYRLRMELRSVDLNDVSQMSLSVFKGRDLLETVTLKGADRDWQTVEALAADMGTFYLRFFLAQAGLQIRSCELRLEKTMAELMAARKL